ncbi:MAG: ampC 2 [Rariglobus sp.]|jgi:CubicO group peptidase (beta-lactamase class C family)|nr:ampC 2 [Rariglobus sp.]
MKSYLALLFLGVSSAAGLSGETPENISANLETILTGSPVPSLAAAAVVDGKIVSVGAWGIRKTGDPTPVSLEDRYHIGSCTKSMTATLGALLIREGKLTWETTVADVFTDLAIHKDYQKVTFRQLVTHTGGTRATSSVACGPSSG